MSIEADRFLIDSKEDENRFSAFAGVTESIQPGNFKLKFCTFAVLFFAFFGLNQGCPAANHRRPVHSDYGLNRFAESYKTQKVLQQGWLLQPWFQEYLKRVIEDPAFDDIYNKLEGKRMICSFVPVEKQLLDVRIDLSSGSSSLDQMCLSLLRKSIPVKAKLNQAAAADGVVVVFTNHLHTPKNLSVNFSVAGIN